MGTGTQGRAGPHERAGSLGCYVYGIVPGAITLCPDAAGVGPPSGRGQVYLVPHEDIAAVVSGVDRTAISSPSCVLAHQRLLDGIVTRHPVVPLRFGTVLSNPEAVATGLLAPAYERFRSALRSLEGCAQYLIKGRYVEEMVLREVLAENPEASSLRDQVNSVPNAIATRHLRIRLGEIVSSALAAKRAADTRFLGDALVACCVASNVRDPVRAGDAFSLALLVKTARQAELEQAAGQVAGGWDGRIRLRVLGPMAPYDFAQAVTAGG